MAQLTYATVFASAGFAGESFDIGVGYNLTYSTTAGDLVFAAAGKTLTLTAGTWPTWIREIGKTFVTDSATNPGPFTVVSIDVTNKILTVLETVVNETPVGVTVANGSADTAIIDNLLSVGNGVLTTDAPLVLAVSGTLGAPRTLNIAALEAESVQQGGQPLRGRILLMSVLASDISPTNKITMSATTSINGAATFDITSTGDYMFSHLAGGVWRCNILPRPAEGLATIARIPFTAATWSAGATKNQVVITQSSAPGAGEVGPHSLTKYGSYVVQVINTDLTPDEMVDVETQFDPATGNITLVKAQKATPFNGVAVIVGSLD